MTMNFSLSLDGKDTVSLYGDGIVLVKVYSDFDQKTQRWRRCKAHTIRIVKGKIALQEGLLISPVHARTGK